MVETLTPVARRPQTFAPQPVRRQADETNVGDTERWLSTIGGGALALYGLSRGSMAGLGLALAGGALFYRGATGHCPAYGTLGINTAGQTRGRVTTIPAEHGVKVEKAITVNRSPEQLYRFWRDFANLPRIMTHLQAVQTTSPTRSHWVAKGPMGTVEWDAEIFNERANELIAWRSLEGSQVDTAGSVHFTPGPHGRGTEIRVSLKYNPPAGKMGAAVARLFGEAPEQQIQEDLRRFKQWMEAGEVPTTAGQPMGRCGR
jgi:uncharacterized membrane protein